MLFRSVATADATSDAIHHAKSWDMGLAGQANKHGYWWDFTHPEAKKKKSTESQKCACVPGFHSAIDVTCHIDAGGHLRVAHPHMVCSGDEWKNPDAPDKCLKRHWAGNGATYHNCKFVTKDTCVCCDCTDGSHHLCEAGAHPTW